MFAHAGGGVGEQADPKQADKSLDCGLGKYDSEESAALQPGELLYIA